MVWKVSNLKLINYSRGRPEGTIQLSVMMVLGVNQANACSLRSAASFDAAQIALQSAECNEQNHESVSDLESNSIFD